MAAQFLAASSQYLRNAAAPVTTYPFSVGMWVYPTTTGGVKTFWGLSDTGAVSQYFELRQSAINEWEIASVQSASIGTGRGGAVTANQWAYVVARFLSATNRLMGILQFDGSVVNLSNGTSSTPTGIDTVTIGARFTSAGVVNPFSGMVGEYWLSNKDIQADGAALNSDTLRQLAYGGPFSIPHVAQNLIEYRALWTALDSTSDNAEEVYFGQLGGAQTWAAVASPALGQHPPLPYWYKKPGQNQQIMLV